MKRRNRFQVLFVIIVAAAALCLLRFGPHPGVLETAIYFLSSHIEALKDNSLLPYGDNAKLKKEAEAAREHAARLELENARLRRELRRLGFEKLAGQSPDVLAARVVGRDPATWSRRVVVNKGSLHGVKPGYIASTQHGLAGRVQRCSPAFCTVQLLTDPDAAVSCAILPKKIQTTPETATGTVTVETPEVFCMAYGNASQTLDAVIVSSSAVPGKGDRVITSGYGGLYPRGLTIGVIAGPVVSKRFRANGRAVDSPVNFKSLDFLVLSPP